MHFAPYFLGHLLPPPTAVIRPITAVAVVTTAVAVVTTAVAVAVAVATPGVALAGATPVGAVAVGITNSGREAETEFFLAGISPPLRGREASVVAVETAE